MIAPAIPAFDVGDLTLTPLVLGEIEDNPKGWFANAPADVRDERVRMPVFCLHVAGPSCSVLIDASDPAAYPVAGRRHSDIHTTLKGAGIASDTITHVILTHGHHDHFCGVWDVKRDRPNFPGARHILSSLDWSGGTLTSAAQFAGGSAADARPLEAIYRMGLLDLHGSSVALPSYISLFDAPGETEGHRVIRLVSRGQTFFFLADLFHVPAELTTPELYPLWANAVALRQSRAQIAASIRQADARFMCSHIVEIFNAMVLRRCERGQ